ncbi:MAG: 50S ribosomal protein L30 [Candidatus Diapherotrites archaeon]
MIVAVRVRGEVNVRKSLKRTLELLNLKAPNNIVLLRESKSIERMLKKVESYITWGEINEETLAKLLEKRGILLSGKKIDKETLQKFKVNSFLELSNKIISGEIEIKKLGLKMPIRARPPKKGYGRKGIKKSFSVGGALGYRGNKINDLISRMV